jgi:hypothetical protein
MLDLAVNLGSGRKLLDLPITSSLLPLNRDDCPTEFPEGPRVIQEILA